MKGTLEILPNIAETTWFDLVDIKIEFGILASSVNLSEFHVPHLTQFPQPLLSHFETAHVGGWVGQTLSKQRIETDEISPFHHKWAKIFIISVIRHERRPSPCEQPEFIFDPVGSPLTPPSGMDQSSSNFQHIVKTWDRLSSNIWVLRNTNIKNFVCEMDQKFHPAPYCHTLVLHLDKSG